MNSYGSTEEIMKQPASGGNRLTGLHSSFEEAAAPEEGTFSPSWLIRSGGPKKTVHIAGLGDVGRTLAEALVLTGGEEIGRIGLFDLQEKQCARMEQELGQVRFPCGSREVPEVFTVKAEELFACDVFLFCATKAVPEVGSGVEDVRLAQFEANKGIVAIYARQAAEEGFTGLFGVVSDPVELLCMAALKASRKAGKGLDPRQIQGFGMGVMYARSLYFASKTPQKDLFSAEGRVFGQHGSNLVAANSLLPEHYDDRFSRELTEKALHANTDVRALGFKPYIAPACSSAALTLLAVLRGEWNDSALWLNGLYFGARCRTTEKGHEWEDVILPDQLFERVRDSYGRIDAMAHAG